MEPMTFGEFGYGPADRSLRALGQFQVGSGINADSLEARVLLYLTEVDEAGERAGQFNFYLPPEAAEALARDLMHYAEEARERGL